MGAPRPLATDVRRRLRAVRAVMRERGVAALVAAATAQPSHLGWVRYLTGSDLPRGRAFVVVLPDRDDPLVVVDAEASADHIRLRSTARAVQVVERRPFGRVLQLLRDLGPATDRIGGLGLHTQLSAAEWRALRRMLPAAAIVNLTDAMNDLRLVKSAAEITAIRATGHVLHEALRLFARHARPGRLAVELAGRCEGLLRAHGFTWGVAKYGFGLRPYLYPAPTDRRLRRDDAFVFEFVYTGPAGYWYILSCLYAFRPLSPAAERLLRATEDAMTAMARIAVPGRPYADLGATADSVFRSHGLAPEGKHTVDAHPIGTDINDGPADPPEGWRLRENMVLALHPGTLARGGRGLFLCDLYQVTRDGAVPLSPRRSFYEPLRA